MKRDEKLNKRKSKKLLVPFCQRKGRNFVATTCDCLSLAVSKTNPWKRLETYSCNHCNLDCPILPATLGKSLDNITFIIIKKFPGDTNLERTTQCGLLWLTSNGYFGEICLRFLESTINNIIYRTKGIY